MCQEPYDKSTTMFLKMKYTVPTKSIVYGQLNKITPMAILSAELHAT